ncbi:MAG: GNAT family N-acetyltransferase [Verrucomicrobiaceae bacterium]|nr:GNAT family N-acetyltransferase [Verrucomicrobiaceae bacterium]
MSNDPELLNQPLGDVVDGWTEPMCPVRAVLKGRFCRLEPLEVERHAGDLFAAYALDVVGANWTYLPYGPFTEYADYVSWMKAQCLGNDPMFFAIVDLASERAVGVASYLRIMPDCGSIEVGHLNFSPKLQRTPAATEALYLMMRHAFELGYRRYEWKCDSLNDPSRTAAQRLGLSFEGIFRQATVRKGRNRDTAWYAAIDKEWPALKLAFDQWLSPNNFDAAGTQLVSLSSLTRPILHVP